VSTGDQKHHLSTFYRLYDFAVCLCVRFFAASHDDIGSYSFGILACDPELLEDVILQDAILAKFDVARTSGSRVE
jgi:hypothetical protein